MKTQTVYEKFYDLTPDGVIDRLDGEIDRLKKQNAELLRFVEAIHEMTSGCGRIDEGSRCEPGFTIKRKARELVKKYGRAKQ